MTDEGRAPAASTPPMRGAEQRALSAGSDSFHGYRRDDDARAVRSSRRLPMPRSISAPTTVGFWWRVRRETTSA